MAAYTHETLVRFDLIYSALHCLFVRFDHWVDGTHAEVLDRNTLQPLADWVHKDQLRIVG